MPLRFVLLWCMAALLGACETPGNFKQPALGQQAEWRSDFPLKEIGQKSINPDECGLALWARGQSAKRLLFAVNARRFAVINFEGSEHTLLARHDRKQLVRGFSETQLYEGHGLSVALDLAIETRQDVRANAVVRDGVLTLTQTSTKRAIVVPVVGVIGCS